MKTWAKSALFIALNIVTFYGLKWYYDTRQVRLVSALLPSVVKIEPIGPIYRYVPYAISPIEIGFRKERVGFGVMGHGSGAFISKDGLIVTCAHVVEGTSLVQLSLNGDNSKLSPIRYKTAGKTLGWVVGRDKVHDVALIRVISPLSGIKPVKVGKSVKKGLSVLTIGFPGPFNKYVTAGVISGSLEGNIFSDLVIAPGNSGGGVFNVNGELVGLARFMTGPTDLPVYQGFSGLTSLKSIRALVSKYKEF
jgi:S1-C subfamily serine protease